MFNQFSRRRRLATGFSLLEMMMVSGLMATMGMFGLKILQKQDNELRRMSKRSDIVVISKDIKDFLGHPAQCASSFRGLDALQTKKNQIRFLKDKNKKPYFVVGKKYGLNNTRILSYELQSLEVDKADAQIGLIKDSNEGVATLIVSLEKHYDGKTKKSYAREIKIPVSVKTESASSRKIVECSASLLGDGLGEDSEEDGEREPAGVEEEEDSEDNWQDQRICARTVSADGRPYRWDRERQVCRAPTRISGDVPGIQDLCAALAGPGGENFEWDEEEEKCRSLAKPSFVVDSNPNMIHYNSIPSTDHYSICHDGGWNNLVKYGRVENYPGSRVQVKNDWHMPRQVMIMAVTQVGNDQFPDIFEGMIKVIENLNRPDIRHDRQVLAMDSIYTDWTRHKSDQDAYLGQFVAPNQFKVMAFDTLGPGEEKTYGFFIRKGFSWEKNDKNKNDNKCGLFSRQMRMIVTGL